MLAETSGTKIEKVYARFFAEIDQLRKDQGKKKISLVLAGKKPTNELIKFADERKQLRIIFLTSPTDRVINALYTKASLFLFPSINEGFGWPIIEAMACGCPVITTRKPPMTEAGGKAAIYIDPSNIKNAAIITNNILDLNEVKRNERLYKGFENLKRFDKNKMVKLYKQAYQDALENKIATESAEAKKINNTNQNETKN